MKLVDILARELKEWPEGVSAIAQGGVTHELYDSSFQLIEPGILVSPAYDRGRPGVMNGSEYVTRAQWQAAVDALKASDSGRDADLKALVDAIMDRMPSTPIQIAVESAKFALDQRDEMIKAIRTPEQIAAEEIQRIRDEIKWQKPQLGPCPVEQMYLLGYRKFEIVDN